MNQKFKIILVDMSNLYHRSYATSGYLKSKTATGEEIITGGTFTSLRTIKKLLREFLEEDGKLYCLYDSPTKTISEESLSEYTNYRREIDPDYKSSREQKSEEFYVGLNTLKLILSNYGENVYSVEIEGVEADDLVGPILKIEKPTSENKALMVSGDLDWARDITDDVYWQNHQKAILNKSLFYEKYKFYPNKLVLQKCFRGDASDGIPIGVKGIRESVLIQILERYSSVEECLRGIRYEEFLSKSWKEKIFNASSRLKLNEKLIKPIPISKTICSKYILKSNFSPSKLRVFYRSLEFKISSIDPRLLSFFPNEKPTAQNFFQQEKLPRT